MSHPHVPSTAVYDRHGVAVYRGDCLDVLAGMPAGSIHAIVTDPPYGLEFMGKDWDTFKPAAARLRTRVDGRTNPKEGKSTTTTPEAYIAGHPFQAWVEQWAVECLRVLKPGGHMLAFGGTRTSHRLTCGIEDAGFEIRDTITWLYGSGFPKNLDVAKALSKQADQGIVQEIKRWLAAQFAQSGKTKAQINRECGFTASDYLITEQGTDTVGRRTFHLLLPYGEKWTRLREVVGFDGTYDAEIEKYAQIVGRVAVSKANSTGVFGDFAGEVTSYAATDAAREWAGWGTALKPASEPIIVARKPLGGTVAATVLAHGTGAINIGGCRTAHASAADLAESEGKNRHADYGSGPRQHNDTYQGQPAGDRAQYDGSAGRWPTNVVLDEAAAAQLDAQSGTLASGWRNTDTAPSVGAVYGNDQRDRTGPHYGDSGGASRFFPVFRYSAKAPSSERPTADGVGHPTVKPLELMRWLVRLVTPPGGTVCDPFAGSGTTGHAARAEGFRAILIELDEDGSNIPRIISRLDGYRDASAAPVDPVTGRPEPMDLLDLLAEGEASA